MKPIECLLLAAAVAASPQKGESDMPMLSWAGKNKVVNHHNEVPFRVLERKWGWGDRSHTESRSHGEVSTDLTDPHGLKNPGLVGSRVPRDRWRRAEDVAPYQNPANPVNPVKNDSPHSPDLHGHSPCDAGENMVIHGDNLAALKALLPRYEGRVKCVYIDPPYNTGEEGWVYNDNVNDPQLKKWLGEVVGKEGEDFSRHDKWLCMMYPRLRLLQKLLADDGAIFISIDDNEFAHLRLICDEIFGSQNFITTFIWEKRVNRENRKVVSSRHDYLLCYAKHIIPERRPLKQLPMTGEALDRYQNPDNDPRGPWKSDPTTAQAGHATAAQFYTLTVPCGKTFDPPPGSCWRFTEPVMQRMIREERIWLGFKGTNMPRKKTYLHEKERGLTPESLWFARDVSTNERTSKKRVKGNLP